MSRSGLLRGVALSLSLSMAVAVWSAAARADGSAEQDLTAAEKAYVDLDFERANQLAEAVTRRHGLTHEQLVRAYRLSARTHAILNHEADARDAFVHLLLYSPGEKEDPNLPPRVTARMLEARGVLSGYSVRPGLEVRAVLEPGGDGGALRVTTRDPTHIVQRVVVGYRWGQAGDYRTASAPIGDDVEVPLPSAPRGATRIDYYAQAFDDRDDAVFEAGNPLGPRTAFVTPVASRAAGPRPGEGGGRSIFASPVFWAVTGGVLAAAGASVYLAVRKPQTEMLPPTEATLSPVLTCGQAKCQ